MNELISESKIAASPRAFSQAGKRICIVTGELAGPDLNGGIGTSNRALALFLRDQGYEVDILYTKIGDGAPYSIRGLLADHIAEFQKLGIDLVPIANDRKWNDWPAKSYLAMEHLLRKQYDLVFFDDTHGTAYYPLLARRTGNPLLRSTTMCVTAHSAMQWIADLNQAPIATIQGLRLAEMERRSIELADVVKAPSAYILRKYRSYGWTIPDNFIVLPNLVSTQQDLAKPIRREKVKEIIFFGRLETRKGIRIFCQALDRLKYQLVNHVVTFLGRETVENDESTGEALLRRSARWPFKIRVLNNFDREQALNYLQGDGRLAVMPSPEDNCPSVVLECLEHGIPFIATGGSGGEELLDEDTRTYNLFEPSVDGLTEKLSQVLADGARSGRPSFDQRMLRSSLGEWLQLIVSSSKMSPQATPKAPTGWQPILIVVVPGEFDAGLAAAQLKRLTDAYGNAVRIEVLAARSAELKNQMSPGQSAQIAVNNLSDFGAVIESVAKAKSTVVGLCHINQMLLPAWTGRAWACFAMEPSISVLTGMVGPLVKSDEATSRSRSKSLEPRRRIQRYLTGFAPALFPLVQETNSGFAILRPELAAELHDMSPLDARHGRLKRMEEWVHEILLKFHSAGHRFEMVPDQFVDKAPDDAFFEVFRLGPMMRASAQARFGYAPGSEQWLLTRLGVDTFLESERARAGAEYLTEVTRKIGNPTARLGSDTPWEDQTRHMAMIAHAGGQIELALDLAASLTAPERIPPGSDLTEHVRSAAKTIRLIEVDATEKYERINLDREWSVKLHDMAHVELHANPASEGRAALAFPGIDLSEVDHFKCTVRVPLETANPLSLKVELISAERSQRSSAEKIVRGGEEGDWEFEIPEKLRTPCRVVLSVEMANLGDSSLDAFARWQDPRFTRRPEGKR